MSFFAVLLLLTGACGEEVRHLPGRTGSIALRLHTPPEQDPFRDVAVLQFIVRGSDGESVTFEADVAQADIDIPASLGDGLSLEILGLDVRARPVASGASAPFDLAEGQQVSLDVLFARTGEFARLGPLARARSGHAAAPLPDGRVLIFGGVGGAEGEDPSWAPPEIYDPRVGARCGGADNPCPSFPASDLRIGHTATPMQNGRVLIFGGEGPGGIISPPALVFDAPSGQFRELVGLDLSRVRPRAHHATALLPAQGPERERVLVAGGEIDLDGRRQLTASGLLFDTQTETFVLTGADLAQARKDHTLTAFGARALAAGGIGVTGLLAEVEIFEGTSFAGAVPVGEGARNGLRRPRTRHVAIPLGGGVLILGGEDGLLSLDDPEWFTWESGAGRGVFDVRVDTPAEWHRPRSGALQGKLAQGAVLFAGGVHSDGFTETFLDSAESFEFSETEMAGRFSGGGALPRGLAFSPAVTLPGGMLLFCGGQVREQDRLLASDEVWIYNPPR
ncbi:MAG: hypothetical protein GYA21_00940 [Myxococcales bacterium]|nr:hypothetical protein [Myxococcales bacterium]